MAASNLRFRYRHVHATIFTYLRDELVTLGWGNSKLPSGDPANAAVNFKVTPMTFKDFQPDEAGEAIEPQTLVVTLGEEPAREDLELGAGLAEVAYPLFIDVYGASQAVAQAVTSDVKDLLEDLAINVKDFTQSPPAITDVVIEIYHEDISSGRPDASLGAQDFKRYWRSVNATIRCQYLV